MTPQHDCLMCSGAAGTEAKTRRWRDLVFLERYILMSIDLPRPQKAAAWGHSRTALLTTRVRAMLKRFPMSESCRVVTAKWNQSCGRKVRKAFSTRTIRKWSIVEMREWTTGSPKHPTVLRSGYDKSVKNGGLQTLQYDPSIRLENKGKTMLRERFPLRCQGDQMLVETHAIDSVSLSFGGGGRKHEVKSHDSSNSSSSNLS